MPRYELMYIVTSNVSDDQIPTITDGVLNFVNDYEGRVISEDKMGKKKLAYPVKKTRNGFYDAVTFEMPATKINEFDAKVRTTPEIIRHLIVNMDEAMEQIAKDAAAQEKMNKNRAAHQSEKAPEATPISDESIEQKIEQALTEDLTNV